MEDKLYDAIIAITGSKYAAGIRKVARKLALYVTDVQPANNESYRRQTISMFGSKWTLFVGTRETDAGMLVHIWIDISLGNCFQILDNVDIYVDTRGRVEYASFDILGLMVGDLIKAGEGRNQPKRLGRKP